MNLFYTPGACSLAAHIALNEAGLDFGLQKVDLKTKTTEDGRDFTQLNPYGYVPALQLSNGEVLTEGVTIAQDIADLKPEAKLAPANGTLERYRLQAALTFINSEVHKTIGRLFSPGLGEDAQAATKAQIDLRLGQLSKQMAGKDWIANNHYSVADGYLFTVLGWLKFFDIDLGKWPVLAAHSARVTARPAVQKALVAEGLI